MASVGVGIGAISGPGGADWVTPMTGLMTSLEGVDSTWA